MAIRLPSILLAEYLQRRHLGKMVLMVFSVILFCNDLLAQDDAVIQQALADYDRDINHLLRDESRKPAEIIEFIGMRSGMRILDVYAADGYYSYIVSRLVGTDGIVYAQNPPPGSNLEDIRQMYSLADALDQRIQIAELGNVVHLRENIFDLSIAAESLDVVMLVQILHDFYNGDPDYAETLLSKLSSLLKPGGIVVVIDHAGDEGEDNVRLHRMQKDHAIQLALGVGLSFLGESDSLHNEQDRRRRSVFDPMLRRNSDRFVLKFQK